MGELAEAVATGAQSPSKAAQSLLETLGVYVSMLNKCDYCVDHHFAGLKRLLNDDERVQKVRQHIFDPFEYLVMRHKEGLLETGFKQELGTIAWHVPCHQRVQNIGPKTRDVLALVPGTDIKTVERCSGHDGTYGVRSESYAKSQKIARPVVNRVKKMEADYLVSDCPMAATQIADGLDLKNGETSPISLLRKAYGI